MTLAANVALLINLISPGRDNLSLKGQVAVRHADAVELQLQVPLTPKMTGAFRRFQLPAGVAAAREGRLARLGHRMHMAKPGIANRDGSRGKVRFVHGALQKGSS